METEEHKTSDGVVIPRFDEWYEIISVENAIKDLDSKNAASIPWQLRLVKGPFTGIVFQYGKFQLVRGKKDRLKLKYDYHVISVPDKLNGVDFTDDEGIEVERILGSILVELVSDHLKFDNGVLTDDE